MCVCVCVVSVIVKRPVLPPSVVDERSRNPLYYIIIIICRLHWCCDGQTASCLFGLNLDCHYLQVTLGLR